MLHVTFYHIFMFFFFFSSRRRHTRFDCDWSSDVCSSDLQTAPHLIEHDLRLPREGLPQELARLRVERRQARHEDEPAGHDDRIDRALPAGLPVGRERFPANADPIHRATLTYQGVLMRAS